METFKLKSGDEIQGIISPCGTMLHTEVNRQINVSELEGFEPPKPKAKTVKVKTSTQPKAKTTKVKKTDSETI